MLLLFFGYSQIALCIGGEWLFQIKYQFEKEIRIGYVPIDYLADDIHPELMNQTDFSHYFRELFDEIGEIPIYPHIIDQEALADVATFPVHPYEIIGSPTFINSKKLKNVEFVRTWSRTSYGIELFTEISLSDSSWFKKDFITEFPTGDDIGCRLTLYNYGGDSNHKHLVDRLVQFYLQDEPFTNEDEIQLEQVLAALKKQKIIVVELCGC